MFGDDPDDRFLVRLIYQRVLSILRGAVVGCLALYVGLGLSGSVGRAAAMGFAFFVLSQFGSLRRWSDPIVVLSFCAVVFYYCDQEGFLDALRLAEHQLSR
jgi:hypothetical protein